jgi:hypothetical protein
MYMRSKTERIRDPRVPLKNFHLYGDVTITGEGKFRPMFSAQSL